MTATKNISPTISIHQDEGKIILEFSGHWLTKMMADIEQSVQEKISQLPSERSIQLTTHASFLSDITGAWFIARIANTLKKTYSSVVVNHLPKSIRQYIGKDYTLPQAPPLPWNQELLEKIGKRTTDFVDLFLSLLSFLGEVLVILRRDLMDKTKTKFTSIVYHIQAVGFDSIPIIALISLLIGAVLSYQSINQLARFGASIYSVDLLVISLFREISVLLTSIVIAGRSGSSFTAQIGTMALNQEIDAIRMFGLNPISVLVIPRLIAILISLPILVLLSVIMGLLGGMIVSNLIIDMPFAQFWSFVHKTATPTLFFVGLSKAPLFAMIIAVVGCFRGFQVRKSAESVGKMTTLSVVDSIFLVIVVDAIMSIFFSILDI